MDVVIYARTSTEEQHLESQVEDLKTFCKENKFNVKQIFTDQISGKSSATSRTGFAEMDMYLKLHDNVSQIICYEFSRFGRSFADSFDNLERFRNNEHINYTRPINVFFKKENLNTLNPNPQEAFTLNILASIAEYERTTILERTKRGRQHSIKQNEGISSGVWLPYGFKNVNKRMVVNIKEAEIVKTIFDLYLYKDNNLRDIARYLEQNNIPTRTNTLIDNDVFRENTKAKTKRVEWDISTISKILKNRLYIGYRSYQKEYLPYNKNFHIVDEVIFNKANEKLINSRVLNTNAGKYENVLRKKIKCGVCGYTYVNFKAKSRNTHFYVCSSKRKNLSYRTKCTNSGIDANLLNNIVYYFLQSAKKDNKKVVELLNENEDKLNYALMQLVSKNKILATLKDNDYETYMRYVDKKMSVDLYNRASAKIQSDIGKVEKEIKVIEKEINICKNEKEILTNSKDEDLSNVDLFKKHVQDIVKQIDVLVLNRDEHPTLSNIFKGRKGNVFFIGIDAGIYGFYKVIASKLSDYFLNLIGDCFNDDGVFIGGSTSIEQISNKDTGLVEEVKHITPMYIKVTTPNVVKVEKIK